MTSEKLLPVPLTPPNVDLMAYPETLIHQLRRLDAFFRRFGIPWYIQSSLATTLHGVPGRNVTDIDVRADWDIHDLYTKVLEHLDSNARLRPHVTYAHGEFRNHCIIIDIESPATHIDITTEINTYREAIDVVLRVPFDHSAHAVQVHADYDDRFPICSLEYLVIYKLANARDSTERKNDLGETAFLLEGLATKWGSSASAEKLPRQAMT